MGSGFSKMKKQAKAMQDQMEQMKNQMEKIEVEASAGNGLVTLTMNGEKKLKKIKIQPECMDPEDPSGLEDLIITAHEEAIKKIEEENPLPFNL